MILESIRIALEKIKKKDEQESLGDPTAKFGFNKQGVQSILPKGNTGNCE